MKGWFLAMWGVGAAVGVRGQTLDEWFNQNSTRLKYDGEQITALQTFIGEAEQGYLIVEGGLATIRDIKTGEFNLHNAFYTSLSQVNPGVSQLGVVLEIVRLQAAIIERFAGALARYRQGHGFSANEVEYIGQVYSAVLNTGIADIQALTDILTADVLKLSDDERMVRIGELDAAMKDRYAFTLSFTDRTDVLSAQRGAALSELGVMKGLYGLP